MYKENNRSKARSYKKVWENRRKNLDGESYESFLGSEYWSRIKRKTKNRESYQSCKICGETENLELHHKHYDLIKTKHELHAIISVCRKCHQGIHDYAKTQNSSLRYATRKYYEMENGNLEGYGG